jgi:hypothetical protein
MKRALQFLMMLAPGGLLFGSSCVQDIRDSAVSGALDYVTGTAEESLFNLLPIADFFARD